MVERRQHLRFALEPGQALRVVGEEVRENLDGDVAVQLGVACPIDLAHAVEPRRGRGNESAPVIGLSRDEQALPPRGGTLALRRMARLVARYARRTMRVFSASTRAPALQHGRVTTETPVHATARPIAVHRGARGPGGVVMLGRRGVVRIRPFAHAGLRRRSASSPGG